MLTLARFIPLVKKKKKSPLLTWICQADECFQSTVWSQDMLWLPDSGRRTENADSPLIPPESDLRPAERQQNRSLAKYDTFGLTETAHLFPYTAVSACGSLPWPCVSTQESEPGRVHTTEHRNLRPRSDLLPYLRANTKMSQIQNRPEEKMLFFFNTEENVKMIHLGLCQRR